jgi:hypothetical protein
LPKDKFMEETDMFKYETQPIIDPEFALVYKAAMQLVAKGFSTDWAVKTALKVFDMVDEKLTETEPQNEPR